MLGTVFNNGRYRRYAAIPALLISVLLTAACSPAARQAAVSSESGTAIVAPPTEPTPQPPLPESIPGLRNREYGTDDFRLLVTEFLVDATIFSDGFESGDTSAWSVTVP